MKFRIAHLHVVSLVLVLTGVVATAQREIRFRSSTLQVNETSTGALLDDEFVFELGAFSSGFTPSAANTENWAANWTPLGRAQYRAGGPRWFNKSTVLENNSAPFQIGGKAFIWGHNADGEWILMENTSWTWPEAVGGINPGGTTFSVANSGTTAVVGAVNPDGDPFQMTTAVAAGDLPDVVPSQWYTQHFSTSQLQDPSITGPLADPDGDGSVNLLELAAGTDPNVASSISLPEFDTIEGSGATTIRVSLQRAGRALMTHALAISSDLETWDISNTDVTVVEDTPTLLILQSVNPVGAFPREFYQFTLDDPNQ